MYFLQIAQKLLTYLQIHLPAFIFSHLADNFHNILEKTRILDIINDHIMYFLSIVIQGRTSHCTHCILQADEPAFR